VVVFVDQTGPRLGFAEFAVRGALGFDHLGGHAQSDGPVDGPATVSARRTSIDIGSSLVGVLGIPAGQAPLSHKQQAIDRATPLTAKPGRYQPPDALLAFLENL
jgi:hypothetical protein